MKIGIRSFFLTILVLGYWAATGFNPALSTDASLLPQGVSQFFDNNGNPLSSGYVYNYEVGTTTFKTTWKDSAGAVVNTNPIRLDAGGKAIIYGEGNYRQIVKDRNSNLIWDAVTAPGGGGSTPTSVGDGNLVGTVLPWSGLVAPNQYLFAYGQEISRTTYPEFYTAVTQSINVICSSASNILTGIADTSQVKIGSAIELSLCVAAGTTVTAKTAATLTLSNPASVSINAVATLFPWGNGNGTTTLNVPDFRGYVMAGRDNMGGTAASRLTTTYFNPGGTSNPAALGAAGGTQSHTQTISEMVAHDHGGHTDGNTAANSVLIGALNYTSPGGGAVVYGTSGGTTTNLALPFHTHTISSQGATTPFSIVQPTVTLNYVVKVTRDTSTSIATGVYSINGMTGTITCGAGILCTGNVISSTPFTYPGTDNLPFLSAATPAWGTITYPTSATSGGIPYFISSSSMASSGILTANRIMIGGGAGAAPTTFACATTTTVVHGGTPPTCSQIVNGDITANTISNDRLNTIAAVTLKGNPTSATATPVDFTLASLTQLISPNTSNDMLLIWDSAAGTFKKITAGSIATSLVAGVASVNGATGALTVTGSAGIVTNTGGTTITITPDTATAANFQAGTANKLLDANVVFTSETTTVYGATTAFDFNTFINTKVTLTGNAALTCSNIKAGQSGTISFIQDGTGTRVITPNSASGWCSQFRFAGVTVPTLTTSASAIDVLSYSCRTTSYCAAALSKGYNP